MNNKINFFWAKPVLSQQISSSALGRWGLSRGKRQASPWDQEKYIFNEKYNITQRYICKTKLRYTCSTNDKHNQSSPKLAVANAAITISVNCGNHLAYFLIRHLKSSIMSRLKIRSYFQKYLTTRNKYQNQAPYSGILILFAKSE